MDQPKKIALKSLQGFRRDQKVLEIGFGSGEILQELVLMGFRVRGSESSWKMISQARDKGFVVSHSEDTKLEWADIMLCFEVIEHLEDPHSLLRRFKGHTLFMSTPCPIRWWIRLTNRREPWDFPPNHLRYWDREEIEAMLRNMGYTSIKVEGTSVQPEELLRIRTSLWGANEENFDDMRGNPNAFWKQLIRFLALPVTWPIAKVLTIRGYYGVSWYIEAHREVPQFNASGFSKHGCHYGTIYTRVGNDEVYDSEACPQCEQSD